MATTYTSDVYLTDYTVINDVINTRTAPVIASVVIGAVGLIANGFVLVVLLGFATLKYRPSVLLILHQTVTDAICSAMTLLTYGTYMTHQGKLQGMLGKILCQAIVNEELFWISFSASTFSLVSITLERYLVVVHPVFHRNHFSKRLVAVLIVLCWVLAVLLNLPFALVSEVDADGYCIVNSRGTFGLIITTTYFLGCFFLPMMCIILAYTHMIFILVKRTKAIHISQNSGKLSKGQMNMTKTMVLVAVVFVICLLPYHIYLVVYDLKPLDINHPVYLDIYIWLLVISSTNCCINPFIYAVKYEAFKTGIRRMCRNRNNVTAVSVTVTSVTMVTELPL